MKYVLTMIGNKPQDKLSPDHVETARRALQGDGFAVSETDWLGADIAADIPFEGDDGSGFASKLEAKLRLNFTGQIIDLVVQQAQGRLRKLLIADMDSTIIQCECIDELAHFAGLQDKVAAITEAAMRGELDFAEALTERAAMLAGLPEEVLTTAYEERVRLTEGATTLVRTMQANGAYTALVSGGFTFFTDRVAAAVGFDINQANILLLEDGWLTGKVAQPILGSAAKLATLERLAEDRNIDLSQCLAVGDGANDIPMIQAAGMGVAFHAKPKTADSARARVDYGDLTALLYIQGIRQSEFVE